MREHIILFHELVCKASMCFIGLQISAWPFILGDWIPQNLQEHEAWCKKYMELYQELRENWERLYWDEGYSKKIAEDHANYDSAEEDDLDFSPYR